MVYELHGQVPELAPLMLQKVLLLKDAVSLPRSRKESQPLVPSNLVLDGGKRTMLLCFCQLLFGLVVDSKQDGTKSLHCLLTLKKLAHSFNDFLSRLTIPTTPSADKPKEK